jgi:anti-anti-sigma regulatory factor
MMHPKTQTLRIEAIITCTRDLGHLALHTTMLSGCSARRPIHLYVDMSGCPAINTAGVDLLVDLHRRLAACGGAVTLVRPPAPVRRLLGAAQDGPLPWMTDEALR